MMANNRSMPVAFLKSSYPWMIVACGMLFYCFNFFLRISPSVMQSNLTEAFHITATQFGLLAACYYWAYTAMQVPAGMIYDKFGVRFVLCVACLLTVIGLSIFVAADDYKTAGAGRFLIGLGCAFSYLGILKLASIWLPPSRFATVAGLATAVGMISGAMAQKYLTHVVEALGYQEALRGLIITGIFLSAIVLLLVRSRPKEEIASNVMQTPMNVRQLFSALWTIICNKQMWLIGIIGFLLYLPSSVFLDLWGISYLKSVYKLTQEQAVQISGCTFYGWIIAGPLIGMISDKIKRRVMPLTFTGFFAAALLCIVFYAPATDFIVGWLKAIFFMIGFCCGGHPLCFALAKESTPLQISGTSVAFTNMFIMLGGVVFQPVVGILLDLHANGSVAANGLPVYLPNDYTFALSVVPLGVAFGIFLSLFLRETHCESHATADAEAVFNDNIDLEPETEAAH